jgi:hypothetical protein
MATPHGRSRGLPGRHIWLHVRVIATRHSDGSGDGAIYQNARRDDRWVGTNRLRLLARRRRVRLFQQYNSQQVEKYSPTFQDHPAQAMLPYAYVSVLCNRVRMMVWLSVLSITSKPSRS